MDSAPNIDKFIDSSNKFIDIKFLKPLSKYDNLVTQNLHAAQISTRPAGANGLWCFTLLPIVLIVYSLQYEVSTAYKLAACLSAGLLFYNILFHIFICITSLVFTSGLGAGCLVSGLITSTLVYSFVNEGTIFVLLFAFPTPFIFCVLLKHLLSYPKTFTLGEAVIVAQSAVISVNVIVAQNMYNLEECEDADLVNGVVITALSTVGLIVTTLCLLKKESRTLRLFIYIFTAAAAFAVIQLYTLVGLTCIPQLFVFLFMNTTRAKLLAFWLSLVLVAVFVLVLRTRQAEKATTVTRKTFHLLAAGVFATGILVDLRLIEMATGVGFGLLILVEALRKSDIEPISSALQSAFLVYSDEKDCGEFALTPLYMYCGLGFGLIAPREAPKLEQLAGVLSVGVGDAAASWFGKRYGHKKWHGQNRTVEGTLFNILSQIMTVYCLSLFDIIDCKNAVFRTTIAATATSLVEAKTDQVDNLVLPLINIIAFQFTHALS
ncbi:dolichol kinase [Leguminivora glycinivorella]|uniref:dolichol kinase n=1 Tax=Leguminivora glycinivorella TaxID=1035111 RepID=UPI00200D5C48|nr:dolichol kinase [Leguminivora glycinivorella]